MNRTPSWAWSTEISAAYELIPRAMHDLIQPDFLCGADPTFVGLHPYSTADDGRSYGTTAHVALPCHQTTLAKANRRVTVVLPAPVKPWVIVHELGHVLHDRMAPDHAAVPVTWYAETNHQEAFAEAFAAYVLGRRDGYGHAADILRARDEHTVSMFNDWAVA